MARVSTSGLQTFRVRKRGGRASLGLLASLSVILMICLEPATAQLVKVPASSGGGNIDWPEPKDGDDQGPPGCNIRFSSPSGLLGPPCALKCVGSASVESDLQAECSAQPENTLAVTDKDGKWLPEDRFDEYDRNNNCTFIKGTVGQTTGRVWYPKGHPRCHGVSGEPHLSTFDDLRYDLQAAGEFIVAKSMDDNLEVQVRLEPFHSFTYLTVATAVAARLGDSRVMIAARPDTPLRIDGEPVELEQGFLMWGEEDGSMILRRESGYSLVWPDGTNLHVERVSHHLDVFLLAAEPRDGRWVGLAGDADGDGANDFRTREGEALAAPPEFETLYRVFAESWRITPEESLFDYAAGESTATFTNRDIPTRRVSMQDIDPAARAEAEERCRAAGVVEAEALEQCIFDVAFTGDDAFIASALIQQTPPEFRDPEAIAVRLLSPQEVTSGSEFMVTWVGAENPQDKITITERAPPHTRVHWSYASKSPALLRAPAAPGEYQVNYMMAQSQTALASEPLTVTAATANLQVPSEVPAGSELEVIWKGPGNSQDRITITGQAPPHTRTTWKYTDRSPLVLRAPAEPGNYVVNYMMAQPQTTLASEPLTVTAVAANLQVPSEVPAGSEFEVIWNGPDNPQDTITITAPGALATSTLTWKYTDGASPMVLRSPAVPGEYRVNYMMAQSQTPLTTEPLTVTAVMAHLRVPSEVAAGSEFGVTWEGPGNPYDVIAIARSDAPPNNHMNWKYTEVGSPITFKAPDEPGEYEVRYVMGPSGHILKTHSFEVR